MKKEDLEKLFNGIEEKIGKDNYAKMADDIGVIISNNENMNTEINNKDNKIKQLQKNNDLLISANGNLLQQIGVEEPKENSKNNQEEKEQKISLKTAFDEKGNFIN